MPFPRLIGNARGNRVVGPAGSSSFQQAPDNGGSTQVRETLFRSEVLAFQQHNRQWGRVVPMQPLPTQILVWCVFAVAAATIALLFVAQYARQETALGYLAPMAATARVFAPQAGIISAVYVRQGETVEKGQVLLSVRSSQIAGDGKDVNAAILATLDQQKQTLTRTVADEKQRLEAERQRLVEQSQQQESLLVQLASQMAIQRQRINIAASMVDMGAQLRAKGLVSEIDQKHRQEGLLGQQQSLLTLTQQYTTRRDELATTRSNLAQLPLTLGQKIQSLQNDLAAAEQRVAEINGRSAYIIRAPISGRVSLLQAAVGLPVDPKQLQLQIIPTDSPLQGELFVPVRAIGFVQVGQPVRIRYDAFPYQQFGTYSGRITKLSRTVLLPSDTSGPITLKEPAYPAVVTLDRPDVNANGKKIPLQPDMFLRADIILEKHTLMDWILAPLRRLRLEG